MLSSVGTLITHTPTFSSAKRFHIPWTSECWSKFLVDPLRVAASAPDTNTTERFNSNGMSNNSYTSIIEKDHHIPASNHVRENRNASTRNMHEDTDTSPYQE